MSIEDAVRSSLGRRIGLIETLRWQPVTGAVRTDLHIARMKASAALFGKAFDPGEAAELISSIQTQTELRLRLLLDEDDRLTLNCHPYHPLGDTAVWKVSIAKTKLDSTNPLLVHKTTERQNYECARAEFTAEQADEVLMENESGFLCEGTITSLFVEKEGTLVTPDLSHGLLRGVLRQEMIESGAAKEGDITHNDLRSYPFFIGNSLRGLIRGRLE